MNNTNQHVTSLGGEVRKITSKLQVSSKRNNFQRSSPQDWFPYYAGFSETFVANLISSIHAAKLCILDPWNGSGTTTCVAHRLGHVAFGFDINPVLSIVSAAKVAHPGDTLHVTGLARRLATAPPKIPLRTDPLLVWLAPSIVSQYRGIEAALLNELASNPKGEVLQPRNGCLPPLASFLLLGLIRTAREIASVRQGSNPTWVRPEVGRKKSLRTFGLRWVERIGAMAEELAAVSNSGAQQSWSGHLGVADCRSLPVDAASVDLIVTSPPYCTRIDYIVSASFELAALGVGLCEYDHLRRVSMGTPLSRSAELSLVPSYWPKAVAAILERIRTHSSKASHRYYYRTFWQYFDDVMNSLVELKRVLRPGGAGALVIQNSYYKDIAIELPELYVACAHKLGFLAEVTSEFEVPRAMSQINPYSRKHQQKKRYRETVVVLERSA